MNRLVFPILAIFAFAISSCSDSKSYAELLRDENQAVNLFLSQHRVIDEIPADTVFETGPNAPYYRIDDEGNVYMQVLEKGTDEKPEKGDRVYFRYMRYNLFYYEVGKDNTDLGAGNMNDMSSTPTFFIYDDFSIEDSYQYGTGIQMPLEFLGYNSKVSLVIKSQDGPAGDMTYVIPYLYDITYSKPQI